MRVSVFYLKRPRKELMLSLERFRSETARFLLEETLWENLEGDRSAWKAADHALRIKILWLVKVSDACGRDEEVIELFDRMAISEGLFDKWWTLSRYGLDDLSVLEQDASRHSLQSADVHGNRLVASWMGGLMSSKS